MEDSRILKAHDISDNGGEGYSWGFEPECDVESQRLFHKLKCSMLKMALHGADKVFMDHRTLVLNSNISVLECQAGFADDHGEAMRSSLDSTQVFEENAVEERRDGAISAPSANKDCVHVQRMRVLEDNGIKNVECYISQCYFRSSAVCGGLKTQKSLAVKVGFALFRSIYVFCMLLGILASGFVPSGFMMKYLVEKPVKTIETLNFDYTKPSPVALAPLMSSGVGGVPYGHKLQMTVSLTVPESEYNHRLGVFQVRVEFLSAKGDVTASSSHPCMLRYKSRPIHYIRTFLRSAPLIAGLQSETEVLNIKINERTEGLEPTACLKVILEQRAEFHHGEGIPQIYAGSLLLQSVLPQLKRFVWYWRKTIFVWTSIASFLAELVFILVFFRPMPVPRGRPETSRRNTRTSNIFKHKTD